MYFSKYITYNIKSLEIPFDLFLMNFMFYHFTWSFIPFQMEFYFSDANLHKDRFLKKAIEATTDGC